MDNVEYYGPSDHLLTVETLWWVGELAGGDEVETRGIRMTLKDVREQCGGSVNDKKRKKGPMCDHPSFRSEAGDAHVETRDGHFDDPNRGDEDHSINRAELMDLDQSIVCPESDLQSAYPF